MASNFTLEILGEQDMHAFPVVALASAAGPSPAVYTIPGFSTARRFAPELRVSAKAAANNQSRKVTIDYTFPNVQVVNGVTTVASRVNATLSWSLPDNLSSGNGASLVTASEITATNAVELFTHLLHAPEIQKALINGFAP